MNPYPILILDDDATILMALQETLKGEGYTYFATSQIAEALQALEQKTFAVVISDQRMSPMTGLQFLRQVKEQGKLCTRILITGVLTTEIFLEAINTVEVFRCLPKPWTRNILLAAIKEAYQYFEYNIAFPQAHRAILQINQQLVEENARLRRQLTHL
ncbi:MAG: response regulator [Puniceicoccales bacterium]|nr:response regulator [Puniceicoccales bacterium]